MLVGVASLLIAVLACLRSLADLHHQREDMVVARPRRSMIYIDHGPCLGPDHPAALDHYPRVHHRHLREGSLTPVWIVRRAAAAAALVTAATTIAVKAIEVVAQAEGGTVAAMAREEDSHAEV